ncbi:DUF2891 domain-containing protein [Parahaliea maris]|uniref:DUF2891 domain-containing protein n=1 Tax=Parahaliea maris TaxID=2716870 RepID=A0A5C9A2T7_9GAMM|nr:DUF2891 domain-containing protein [Parahaliea maris]TXS95185.1 DUF2891 domain-containing protein [Parahaliea maris]
MEYLPRRWLLSLLLLALSALARGAPDVPLPEARPGVAEDRFATLALSCIHRPYPTKIAHVLQSAADALPPQQMTPAFYGCFDWHSSVHGHWLLVRILNTDPESPFRGAIETALGQSLTADNLRGELAYYRGEGRKSFERPYGIAWFLQLVVELEQSPHPLAPRWRANLQPLEAAIVAQIKSWLGNLQYPVRVGTHNQSAFAFTLMLDYARVVADVELEDALTRKALAFHLEDRACPLNYEPSGEDFLSPCLEVADLMRRIMTPERFAKWLEDFLPQLPTTEVDDWLEPGIVTDPTDGKLAHLHGLNLSRAWALEGVAGALPAADKRRPALLASARLHRARGLAAVSAEHYEGSHWLGSFATYLTTGRGL